MRRLPVMDLTPKRRAVARISTELAEIGFILPGTVLRRHTRCGRGNCRCHADPPQLHGPYWWWTRRVGGKTVTRILSDELYEDYRAGFEGARRARALLAELEALSLVVLEADPRYGRRRGRGPTAPTHAVDKPRSRRR